MNTLFTEKQYQKLIENGNNADQDHAPVARLHLPLSNCQWLLSELDPSTPDVAFGLCDLGQGFPELGYVLISEIMSLASQFLIVSNDTTFKGKYPMSVYCDAARLEDEITTDETILSQCAEKLKLSKLQP